ncbi:unnamed protein product [Rotaria magnacalcarata]|uniref:DUF1761 domain-containing protein n=2 Tax=Rotaria magnacalcarata TaxID=392030 RepID=A0A816UFR3_9BILA|nr:unnamed protein product [Rotaria magnacalcarata]CAF1416791.1 unnamed protein product [Rotaria magnacalcarata]CAF1951373.1 unnamed protein product [Rotaria magnacalcarata]CAF2113497.1 unnamed protein product [Rotaria magnacalcarata]CAF2249103.1 unnamed protein product [Rotaria magnacalcarata]
MVTLNYFAIATCTLLNMILGMLWYSPILFGTLWVKLMGFDYKKMKNDPNIQKRAQKGYIISSICHLLMTIMMAHFTEYTHASGSWFDGLKIGFCCWLGFTVTTMLPNQVFSKDNFSWLLTAINLGYPMVGLSMAGTILAAWH